MLHFQETTVTFAEFVLSSLDPVPLLTPSTAQDQFTKQLVDKLHDKYPNYRFLIIQKDHVMTGEYTKTEVEFKFHSFKPVVYQVYAIENMDSATLTYTVDGEHIHWWYDNRSVERNDSHGILIFKPVGQFEHSEKPKSNEHIKENSHKSNLILITNHHANLSAHSDGSVGLSNKAGESEKWAFHHLGDDHFTLQSHNGNFLEAHLNGIVDLISENKHGQTWTRVPVGNDNLAWKSHFGTYLTGNPDGKVTLEHLIKDEGKWKSWI